MKKKIRIIGITGIVLFKIVIIAMEVAFALLFGATLFNKREDIICDLLYDRTFEQEEGTWIADDCGIIYSVEERNITAVLMYKGKKIAMNLGAHGTFFRGDVMFMVTEMVEKGKRDITGNEEVNRELKEHDGFLFRTRIINATDKKVIFEVEESFLEDFQYEKIEFKRVK